MDGLYSFIALSTMLAQFILNKIIVVDVDERKMSDTTVYKWYLLGSWIVVIPIIVAIWTLNRSQPQPLYLSLVTFSFCFRAYMEWKYIRETKRHIVSIILAAISLFFTGLLLFLRILNH